MKKYNLLFLMLIILANACQEKTEDKKSNATTMKPKRDVHTFSNYNEIQTKHLNLNLRVDFETKTLQGIASLTFERKSSSKVLILDTKDLTIKSVTFGIEQIPTTFKLLSNVEHLGQALEIQLDDTSSVVNILYSTSPNSEALMWLSPEQTFGKKHPFVFTQGEAILSRTWIPLQDSPDNKITYTARIECPENLLAVMSAENKNKKNNLGIYNFEMEIPVAPYLIALAVGNLEFKMIDHRTGVYAEPEIVKQAQYEFEDTGEMLTAAENLYGEYMWGRYDILVLPPSFPFGGMENPRLTFVTPTILAGDKSLTALIAHEMAHSWSGNVVTNATWDDFWLNEGFTVYFERRIMEAMYGKDYADMLALLGKQDLESENKAFFNDSMSADTRLKLNLEGRNPDDGMSDIAYEKGAFFLTSIEKAVGRDKFDAFLKSYFTEFANQSIVTEDFVNYLNKNLLEPNKITINTDEWIYKEGIPENCPKIESKNFLAIESAISEWQKNKNVGVFKTDKWTTHEWLHFLRGLPSDITIEDVKNLDKKFNFTNSTNSEIAFEWFLIALKKDYKQVLPKMEEFLIKVGRRKFLTPLYEEMIKNDSGKLIAMEIYKKARPNYHFVSTNTLDNILKYKVK